MTERFLGALQFLTIWPVHGKTAPLGKSAVFFPLTGVLLGAATGGVMLLCARGFAKSIAATLAIAWLIAITGCLHEDGLADVADAIRAGRTREKMMLILKDSRIGPYGAVALLVSILLRIGALMHCQLNPVTALSAALGLSRTALVLLAAITAATGEGLGRMFTSGLSRPVVAATLAQAIAFSFVTGWHYSIALLLATAIVIILARAWFGRRLGGVNGDCLGATCQAVETINLLILAWQPSF